MPTYLGHTQLTQLTHPTRKFVNVYWNFSTGVIDNSFWEYPKQIHDIFSDPAVKENNVILMTIIFDVVSMKPEMRQAIANAAKDCPVEALKAPVAHAFVTNSLLGRGSLTAINWLVRKEFPEKCFAKVGDAEDWLNEKIGVADMVPVFKDICKALDKATFNELIQHNYFFGSKFFR
jgi:hypothetical protein